MIEMHVTEAWKLADFHNIINYTTKSNKRPITMHWFEGVLGHQMISNASSCSKHYAAFRVEPEKENLVPPTLVTDSFSLNISLLSDNCVGSPCLLIPVCSLSDCQGAVHHQVKLPIQIAKNGKWYTKQWPYKQFQEKVVQRDATFYCYTCRLSASFSCPTEKTTLDCFKDHVDKINPPWMATRSIYAV